MVVLHTLRWLLEWKSYLDTVDDDLGCRLLIWLVARFNGAFGGRLVNNSLQTTSGERGSRPRACFGRSMLQQHSVLRQSHNKAS